MAQNRRQASSETPGKNRWINWLETLGGVLAKPKAGLVVVPCSVVCCTARESRKLLQTLRNR